MKVALDVSAVPARVAGAGRYVVELARRLPDAGLDLSLVARRGDAGRWAAWSPSATVAAPVPRPRPLRLAYEALVLGRGALARGVDVWHAPHYTMPARAAVPTVVTIHDLTYFTHPEWHERAKAPFFRRAITRAASRAGALICVSDFTARELARVVEVTVPVVVAPLGVDLDHFTPEGPDDGARLASLDLAGSPPAILFVGTDEPRKGLDVLVDAFATIGDVDPEVELWVCGQRGWGDSPVTRALVAHRHRTRIRHLGYVDEPTLAALYRRATVVAYPSRGEGFGLPVLEALACGASVVTTANTVMADVAGDAARLVAIGDAADLARALKAALDEAASPDRRAERSATGRRRAATYTWDRCVTRHLEAYQIAAGR